MMITTTTGGRRTLATTLVLCVLAALIAIPAALMGNASAGTGYPEDPAYYQFVGSSDWSVNGATPPSERCGSKALIQMTYDVASRWHGAHPTQSLRIGDIHLAAESPNMITTLHLHSHFAILTHSVTMKRAVFQNTSKNTDSSTTGVRVLALPPQGKGSKAPLLRERGWGEGQVRL